MRARLNYHEGRKREEKDRAGFELIKEQKTGERVAVNNCAIFMLEK